MMIHGTFSGVALRQQMKTAKRRKVRYDAEIPDVEVNGKNEVHLGKKQNNGRNGTTNTDVNVNTEGKKTTLLA